MLKLCRGSKQASADYFGGRGSALMGLAAVLTRAMPADFFWSRVNGTAIEYDREIRRKLDWHIANL